MKMKAEDKFEKTVISTFYLEKIDSNRQRIAWRWPKFKVI